MRLSSKERNILAAAQLDSELPIASIAKDAGVAPHVARHALQRMRETGVISHFPFVNVYPLGFEQYGVFFSMAGKTTVRAKVLQALIQSPSVSWVVNLGGDFQYSVGLCVRRGFEVTRFLENMAEKFGDIFFEKSIAIRVSCTLFQRGYLSRKAASARPLHYGDTGNSVTIDALDHYILRAMTALPYTSIRDLGQRLAVPHTTIQSRLIGLRKNRVLVGIPLGIDPFAIGMLPYRLLIYVTRVSAGLRDGLRAFAQKHPNVFAFIECVGSWDYELKVEVETASDLNSVTDAIYDTFGHAIHTIKVLSVLGTSKLAFYPMQEPPSGRSELDTTVGVKIPKEARRAFD